MANDYTPSGKTLEKFHLSKKFVRTLMGPLGSGKTTACCYEIMRRSIEQETYNGKRKTRWLVCRNTIPELETTTIPSWEQHFGIELGSWKRSSPITHQLRINLGDGTKVESDVYFLGLDGQDAAARIRGMELTGGWVNEAKDVPKSIIDMMTGRVGRYPPKAQGGPTWFGIIADTNMPDDDHWMYELAEKDTPEGWEFFKQPGGVIKIGEKWFVNELAENMIHLPENYYKNQLAGKKEPWIKVYLASEYGYTTEGRPVFPEYSDVHHVMNMRIIEGEPVYIGVDLGLTPAAVFLQKDSWGRLLVMDELVTNDIGAVKFAKAIKLFMARNFPGCPLGGAWGDPIGAKRSSTDENERTTFQIIGASGLHIRPAPGNNELIIRREAVAGALTRLVDGKPGIIFAKKCLKLRAGMSGKYCFKRVHVRGDVYADTPKKDEYSHIADALQYVLLGLGEGSDLLINKNMRISTPKVVTGTRHSHRVVRRKTVSPSGRSTNYKTERTQ